MYFLEIIHEFYLIYLLIIQKIQKFSLQLTVDKTEKAVGDSDPEDTDENDQEAKAKALADQEVMNLQNIIIAAVIHVYIFFFIFINFAKKNSNSIDH